MFTLTVIFLVTIAFGLISALLGGAVGTFVVQGLKKALGASGKAALTLTIVVSIAISILALAVTGELSFTDPNAILATSTGVFTISTLVYKYLVADKI
jgi:hypothetical protein